MMQLLFGLIFTDMALIVVFLFETPLRKPAIKALDEAKRGRGPVIVKTVAVAVFVVMMTTVFSLIAIQRRRIRDGDANPTDKLLIAKRLLEASLMGFSLFLALVIDRLHHYIRELHDMEELKKQNQTFEKLKALRDEKTTLNERTKQLESQIEQKAKEARIAEASRIALRKQSKGFRLEYDRLNGENQKLRRQLQSLDRKFSRSNTKKDL